MSSHTQVPIMTRISCAQGRWRIDGHAFLVICGEIDYFRVPANDWADRLGRLKANGANAVATYIPWLLHEPVEGRFEFTTDDLTDFIDACAACSRLSRWRSPNVSQEAARHITAIGAVSTPVWNSAPPSMPTAGSPGPLLVWRSTRDGALLTFAP